MGSETKAGASTSHNRRTHVLTMATVSITNFVTCRAPVAGARAARASTGAAVRAPVAVQVLVRVSPRRHPNRLNSLPHLSHGGREVAGLRKEVWTPRPVRSPAWVTAGPPSRVEAGRRAPLRAADRAQALPD